MEGLPPAMILATEEDVIAHGHVLYGLVKPSIVKERIIGVESTASMVNVMPRKRMYRMEEVDDLETFKSELLKRPLVLQPEVKVIQIGWRDRICNSCVLNSAEENWIFMINQTHPKVLGRIQMGVDAAKKVLERGEPFVLEYTFSDALKRLYFDVIAKGLENKGLREADWSFGDLVVRYPGDAEHQGMMWSMKACHIRFAFEDIGANDVLVRTISMARTEMPAIARELLPAEILQRRFLPGWKIEQVSAEPTENVRYDYDQADQMYRSYDNERSPRPEVESADALKPVRIRGRSNRTTASSKYEVPVELHAPGNDLNPEDSSMPQRNLASRYDHEHVERERDSFDRIDHRQNDEIQYGMNGHLANQHRQQGSITDSGFDDQDSNGSYKHNRSNYQVSSDRNGASHGKSKMPYDNRGFEREHNSEDILQKHKELAAKMLRQNASSDRYGGYDKSDVSNGHAQGQELETQSRGGRYGESRDYREAPYDEARSDRVRIGSDSLAAVSESFI